MCQSTVCTSFEPISIRILTGSFRPKLSGLQVDNVLYIDSDEYQKLVDERTRTREYYDVAPIKLYRSSRVVSFVTDVTFSDRRKFNAFKLKSPDAYRSLLTQRDRYETYKPSLTSGSGTFCLIRPKSDLRF